MKTSGNHLIDTNVYGTQDQVKKYSIFHTLYKNFYDIDFKNTFFALNVIHFDSEKLLNHNCKKIVLSFQSEYIDYYDMFYTFNNNKDKVFLLLTDFYFPEAPDKDTETHFWPDNVTCIQWISWGEQIKYFANRAGVAKNPRNPSKKLSSLSHRHEFHRSAVTAFILNNFSKNDIILSWHSWTPNKEDIYYLKDDYCIHNEIKKQLNTFNYHEKILLDEPKKSLNYFRNPVNNYFWDIEPYLDCAVNLTNETAYSSVGRIDEMNVVLPTPLITEKTFKALLAGTAFVSVGQPFLLRQLNLLGIRTDFGFPSKYDEKIFEDERMLEIYETLTFIRDTPTEKIYKDSYDAVNHNLRHIRSQKFLENCKHHNRKHIDKIYEWSLISP